MREIKFRAWDIRVGMMNRTLALGGWRLLADGSMRHIEGPEAQVVLMQFTGLCDTHGKEIYEGDIVRFFPDDKGVNERGVVRYSDFWGAFTSDPQDTQNANDGLAILPAREDREVIGNIYENPGLLDKPGKQA